MADKECLDAEFKSTIILQGLDILGTRSENPRMYCNISGGSSAQTVDLLSSAQCGICITRRLHLFGRFVPSAGTLPTTKDEAKGETKGDTKGDTKGEPPAEDGDWPAAD